MNTGDEDRPRKLVRGKLEEKSLDRAILSRAMNRNHAYLQQFLERGVPLELKERDRELQAPLLDLEPDDLRLTPRGGARSKQKPQPMRAQALAIAEYDIGASAGQGIIPSIIQEEDGPPILAEWTMPADMLRAHTNPGAKLVVVRVEGDSMEPDYLSGDRVLIDTSRTRPTPPGVFVVWDGLGLVLKRAELVMGQTPMRLRLSSINSAYQPYEALLDDIHIAGRVIGKWMWR